MGCNWSTSTFVNFLKFLQIKEGELISWWEPILQNGLIIWSSLLYFNFRNLKHPKSLSFIRFEWVLHDSPALFSIFWSFLKFKRGDLICCIEGILQNSWIIWSSLLHFNFRNLRDSNSLLFIGFQLVLHDSKVLFSIFWNFLKFKRGDLICCIETILQNS